jgi:hypothetical protein
LQSLESACAREIALYECEVCSVKQGCGASSLACV